MENSGLCLTPFQHRYLLKSLETDLRAEYRRRIEIMLLFDAGESQAQICEALGCSQETARYWITIAQTGQAHKWSDRLMGRAKIVNEQYVARLKKLVNHNPHLVGYSSAREFFAKSCSCATVDSNDTHSSSWESYLEAEIVFACSQF
ncbi:MAG: helix-turn-helix domain-containing protein [Nostoc sp. DedQUE08]|uniref:helix-turn-helix domain-containing protein n=1 Tax=Nostoc sp. DedQUE08 TaxID=3075393 RepID=UPI002AD3B526|nr:helix-turn-helix domain-containing protein [Nostoc sp. DedQUE08]MDZ8065167.1 helix-turn-helix domain-containing protein [Nostoc sp. DedQUE08]